MRRAAGLPPPPAPRPPARRPLSFRRVFVGVLIAHLLVLLGIAFLHFPARKAAGAPGEPQPIAMFEPVSPAAAAPPAPAPMPQPTPTPPQPQPETPPTPPQPEPTPVPAPEPAPEAPAPAPSDIVLPPKPPQPAPKTPAPAFPKPAPPPTPAAPASAPAKPEKRVPKVSLTEVTRDGGPASPAQKTPAHTMAGATGDGQGAALKASDVARQLSGALQGSASAHVAIPGSPGQGGDNGDAAYYALIQQAMYAAWDQPSDLIGRHLVARIEVHIARDGTITGCSLAGTSGNAGFDQTALAAARRVGRLSKPRPDAVPETVAINFKLAD